MHTSIPLVWSQVQSVQKGRTDMQRKLVVESWIGDRCIRRTDAGDLTAYSGAVRHAKSMYNQLEWEIANHHHDQTLREVGSVEYAVLIVDLEGADIEPRIIWRMGAEDLEG